jgi:hypothetical protein
MGLFVVISTTYSRLACLAVFVLSLEVSADGSFEMRYRRAVNLSKKEMPA